MNTSIPKHGNPVYTLMIIDNKVLDTSYDRLDLTKAHQILKSRTLRKRCEFPNTPSL